MKNDKYKIITIENKYSGLRLDKFLQSIFRNTNNVLIQKALRNKDILVNMRVAQNNYHLKVNDNVCMTDFIINYVEKNFESYKISDMNIGTKPVNNISEKIRENILKDKFEELQSAKLVITDRLHGMIFSAITETPCVVFDSLTHKIIESYDWFKNLGYIQMCKNINNLENCIKKAINFKPCIYNNDFAKKTISNILIDEIGDES